MFGLQEGFENSDPTAEELASQALFYTYVEFRRYNIIGSDQYFHCLAACRATKASGLPDYVRSEMQAKEDRDYALWSIGLYRRDIKTVQGILADINRDLEVNEYGLQCPVLVSCKTRCQTYIDSMVKTPNSRQALRDIFRPERQW